MNFPSTDLARLLDDIREADADLTSAPVVIADRRASLILQAVEAAGRGGRDVVAEALDLKVGAIDVALRRARGLDRPNGLSEDPARTLRLLIDAERSRMAGLPADRVAQLGTLLAGTWVDATWLQMGLTRVLAMEIEDSELPEADRRALTDMVGAWTEGEALAVVTAILDDSLESLRYFDPACVKDELEDAGDE